MNSLYALTIILVFSILLAVFTWAWSSVVLG